jgi:hypothetical protein
LSGTVLALIGSLTKADEFLKRVEKNLLIMNFKTKLCEAYKALANYYRARSNNHRVRDYLLLLKEIDPLCEQADRLLIEVYASGKKSRIFEMSCRIKI